MLIIEHRDLMEWRIIEHHMQIGEYRNTQIFQTSTSSKLPQTNNNQPTEILIQNGQEKFYII